jgi:hypothetical protein
MNGIPIRIRIDGDEEEIYLAVRGTGDRALNMQRCKRTFHRASQKLASELQRVGICASLAMQLDPAAPDYADKVLNLLNEQEAAQDRADELRAEALEASTELLRLSLLENYGNAGAVDRYLAVFSDKAVNEAVSIIETGDCPAGFTPSRGIRQSGTTTTRDDDGN